MALDLYFRCNPSRTNADNPETTELSDFLRTLPVHGSRVTGLDFRSTNGVYMKSGDFLSLDLSHLSKGIDSVLKLDREVWAGFANDYERPQATVKAIRNDYQVVDALN